VCAADCLENSFRHFGSRKSFAAALPARSLSMANVFSGGCSLEEGRVWSLKSANVKIILVRARTMSAFFLEV
jgi:hypothetical protein